MEHRTESVGTQSSTASEGKTGTPPTGLESLRLKLAEVSPIKDLGNELSSELFDACAMLKGLQHQLGAIEADEVHSARDEAHDAGRALRKVHRLVYELASLLADCEVAPHPSHVSKLRALLGLKGGAQ